MGKRLLAAFFALGLLSLPVVASAAPAVDVDLDSPGTGAAVHAGCDPLDAKACLLPFPNDFFTKRDRGTVTGRRVRISKLAMPRNRAGKPIDPAEWNRNDGFSPSSPVLTYVPQLNLHATWGTARDQITDIGLYAEPDAPIVVLDATTGHRHPFWSELDTHAGTSDAERLLILHPAVQFTEGHRYVVALRKMRRTDGTIIPAGRAFAAYKAGTRRPAGAGREFDARRPQMDRIFRDLSKAGVARRDLYLAWDFTVISRKSLSERVLHIRDQSFAALGDRNLADGKITGRAPEFAVTRVEDMASGPTMRRIEGTVTVPNYMTPQVELTTKLPPPIGDLGAQINDAFNQLPAEVRDGLDPVTSASPVDVDDVLTNSLAVPSKFHYTANSGLPQINPVQPTVDVPFVCNIARGSDKTASHPFLYGHGLLGSRTEANGSSTERLRERGFSPCAVDWWGLSFSDLPNVAVSLTDFSFFGGMIDRMQQGFLNFLFLGRALAHPQGLATNAAFRNAKGQPLIRTNELFYDGNSQGAIMGGALTALGPDFKRSVLGVPGMAYATLLNRSVDWEGQYAVVYEATYPDPVDEQLGYALIQMLWDRGETSGYAQHMTTNPLPNTPSHDVMLQVAFADHQVANVAAEVEGRTIGAAMKMPAVAGNRHWAVDPAFGFRTVTGNKPGVGAVLVYWFADGTGLVTPPNGNVPSSAGSDPHGVPRKYGPATDQVVRFLLTGDLIDVCGGKACVVPKT
ncbi:MAG TPA: hypothetical protein VFB78_07460 [Acidimicrobiales bacterium]|nr:hypothetical protein [Acidimicrobiales bacterium]